MLFIYLFERNPAHVDRVRHMLSEIPRRGHTLCTSVLTVGEVLTGFHKRGAMERAAEVRRWMTSPPLELLPFTADFIERYAAIRASHAVTPSDAIHLATAADVGVQLFVTNDSRLRKLRIDRINFIAGPDVNVY